MNEMKPIIFSAEMVQAILEGRKSQTRRVIKPQPVYAPYANDSFGTPFWEWKDCQWIDGGIGMPESAIEDYAPYQPGDILWARETWGVGTGWSGGIIYKADYPDKPAPLADGEKWRPSIHMPREAARIFLRVTNVRAERLREMDVADCLHEGIIWDIYPNAWTVKAKPAFITLWNSLNAKDGYGWDVNPWVWACTFKRCDNA